jgi:single-strand DNA-binding protein
VGSFNKCILVGYVGSDPQLKYTAQGKAVCKFSVATTERRKDAQGEYQDATTWFRATVWGRQAEWVGQNLQKSQQVYVEGKLRQEEYTDRDGNKRTSLDVSANDVQLLGSRGEGSGSADPQAPAGKPAAKVATKPSQSEPPDEDDIPF